MTLEELKQESYKDLPVKNMENIDQESFYNQEIKAKWLDYKTRFELLLAKSKGDYQVLYREKWEYYGGKSDAKVYAAKPFDLKVLKTDLQIYISSDNEVIAKCIVIAGGAGSFVPRKPSLLDIEKYEGKSIFFSIKDK